MKAYITVKLPDGTDKEVVFGDIKQVFVSVKGEKTVLFICDEKLGYCTEVQEEQ